MEIIRKDIPGYEGVYYATSDGFIYGYERMLNGKNSSKRVYTERKLPSYFNTGKYLCVRLTNGNGKLENKRVHRLIAITFLDNPENKPTVNHKNGIKTDNRVDNLEWATAYENNKHARDTGLRIMPKGGDNPKSFLTNEQAKQIKISDKANVELAKIYGVKVWTIYSIRKNITYKTA